jgi:hypothetical protein
VSRATLCAVCCDDDTALDLPPAVIEMLARYRRMRAEQGVGWGEVRARRHGSAHRRRAGVRAHDAGVRRRRRALQELAQEQGLFDRDEREHQFGDLIAVLDRARAYYRAVAAASPRSHRPSS